MFPHKENSTNKVSKFFSQTKNRYTQEAMRGFNKFFSTSNKLILSFAILGHRVLAAGRQKGWMSNVHVQGKTLFELCLPGSHNTTTYRLHSNSIAKGSFMKGAICCQRKSLLEQLNAGIRALDIRVKKDIMSGKCNGSTGHGGFRCVDLDWIFDEICTFLNHNEQEIICVRIAIDKPCNLKMLAPRGMGTVKAAVYKFLERAINMKDLGGKLAAIELRDAVENNATVRDLVDNTTRVVLMFDEDSDCAHIQSMYKETKASDAKSLLKNVIEALNKQYNTGGKDNKGAEDQILRWVDLQVTNAVKGIMQGYDGVQREVAELAIQICNLERLMGPYANSTRKVVNFVGMDCVDDSHASTALISAIIKANQGENTRDPHNLSDYATGLPDIVTSVRVKKEKAIELSTTGHELRECGVCYSDIRRKRCFQPINSFCDALPSTCTGRCSVLPYEWSEKYFAETSPRAKAVSSNRSMHSARGGIRASIIAAIFGGFGRRRLNAIQKHPMTQLLSQTN